MTDTIRVSIFRRKDRELFEMQYRHPVTGQKVRRSTGRRVRRDAERVAAKWEAELREGRYVQLGRIAWSEFRERYENQVLFGLADKTFVKASSVLNVFERTMKPVRLASVTPEVLSAYATSLRRLGRSENTIKGHLAHIGAALSWAVDQGLIPVVPRMPATKRARSAKVMRGRPLTDREFLLMLRVVRRAILLPGVQIRRDRRRAVVASWRFLLRGLWLSGLRLNEAMGLTWERSGGVSVAELDGDHPMFLVPAEAEKAHEDRVLPMSPEFAEFLREVPVGERTGYVFNPLPRRLRYGKRPTSHHVGTVISRFGESAGVVVDERLGADGETIVKHATAHDLRRSFGERWAHRVMPPVLQQLMRHESIQTTMRYYVGRNAQATSAVLWEAHRLALGATLGATGQSGEIESP